MQRRSRFHEQIEQVLAEVVRMMELVERATARATTALLEGDRALAEHVISDDDEIDDMFRRLDERALELVATQAPVATDLRALFATMRMIGDLERSGDLAVNIAKITRHLESVRMPARAVGILRQMGETAVRLLQHARSAVSEREPDAAERLDLMDDVMDDLRRAMFTELFSREYDGDVEAAVHLSLISRYYERIADHAVAVAERVEFLVTGKAHEAHVGL